MKTRFQRGDTAIATKKISRADGKSVVNVGERVRVTSVHESDNYQIVSLDPFSGKLPMIDVCCDINGPLKPD